ncbi:alkaline phosphatase [Reichenbachiella sp. 5M10]|uniref:alkaline phosphatase PafA n=1 Tax=Reichenbachiella sp. 5M10 TaxID=1889772 RepID=UPI000C14A256|nr:alkaline phosphatase PafA [Reichenbachiella sp. 5M10]PIB35659.1 alkaline phosphatase [Reichenbachiella sp. 5M10]
MKKIIVLALGLMSSGAVLCQQSVERPKLVVGIIVDQMRAEYLYRFQGHYGQGGFRRMMDGGFELKNAHFNYVPTKTAPGHASVYTGATPRVHGVIANDWYDKVTKEGMYCVSDPHATFVGGSEKTGHISPVNLVSTTITDELGLFFQQQSKIIGMSIKDRGAVLPAGHDPNGAYWLDSQTGEFMTSSYYMDKLPKWVQKFNKRGLVDEYMSGSWDTFLPIEKYVESGPDDRENERALVGKERPVFPYDLSQAKTKGSTIKSTPWGNTILADFAKASLEGESLGQDDITDFLAVSFSSTDYIGHSFGPYSKEVEDTYIRLDRDLEALFQMLDEKVGKGQWTVFLSADHAVAAIPQYLKDNHLPADYWGEREVREQLNEKLQEVFGAAELVENVSNEQVFLNHDVIEEQELSLAKVKEVVMIQLRKTSGIKAVYASEDISNYSGKNYDVALLSAGYNQQRSGDVLFTINSGWLGGSLTETNHGTSHGTHYTYDTHVPMLFYGWGIKQGKSHQYHPVTDIAPTLSMLLNISFPSGATGQPIVEILD